MIVDSSSLIDCIIGYIHYFNGISIFLSFRIEKKNLNQCDDLSDIVQTVRFSLHHRAFFVFIETIYVRIFEVALDHFVETISYSGKNSSVTRIDYNLSARKIVFLVIVPHQCK